MKDPSGKRSRWLKDSPFRAFSAAGPLFGSGIQLAAAAVLMFFLGRWLDAYFGTAPWLMIIFVTFGVGGGMYNFIRAVGQAEELENDKNEVR
jgi:F0F1-type ATP synthase assembly protein I